MGTGGGGYGGEKQWPEHTPRQHLMTVGGGKIRGKEEGSNPAEEKLPIRLPRATTRKS